MKRPFPVVIFLLLLFTANRLHTDIFGLSLGTISFNKSNETFPPGLYIMPGLIISLSETLEIELSTINQITPLPFSLGNVVTGCREKVLAFGLLYDIGGRDLLIIWQLLCFSFYGFSYAEE